jgi:hypothetical protein
MDILRSQQQDAELFTSQKFDEVAGLFADASRYGSVVWHGSGEKMNVRKINGTDIPDSRIVRLSDEYVLTSETIATIQRTRRGRIAVQADALQILQTQNDEDILAMRARIRELVASDFRVYGYSVFKSKTTS